MTANDGKTVAVLGATGLQGGAVARRLLADGWGVRALTRDPSSAAAKALATAGAEVVKVDADDPATLDAAFAAAHGVFNVQNHHHSGFDGEVRQGRNVVDAALRAGVALVVYGSAGFSKPTGVGSWDTKVKVQEHAAAVGAPITVLRPMAFMELMTEKKFYAPASVWHLMPKLMGEDRPVGWLSVDDLAALAAQAFADPQAFAGRDLSLVADVKSIGECRALWRSAAGRPPKRFPMPEWLFRKFTGTDELTMWRWLRTNDLDFDVAGTRAVLPTAMTVEQWMGRVHAGR